MFVSDKHSTRKVALSYRYKIVHLRGIFLAKNKMDRYAFIDFTSSNLVLVQPSVQSYALACSLHKALFELKNEYKIYRSLRLSWKSYHGTHQYKLLPAKKFPKPFELNFARRLVRKILEAFYKVGFEFVTSASIITDKETLIFRNVNEYNGSTFSLGSRSVPNIKCLFFEEGNGNCTIKSFKDGDDYNFDAAVDFSNSSIASTPDDRLRFMKEFLMKMSSKGWKIVAHFNGSYMHDAFSDTFYFGYEMGMEMADEMATILLTKENNSFCGIDPDVAMFQLSPGELYSTANIMRQRCSFLVNKMKPYLCFKYSTGFTFSGKSLVRKLEFLSGNSL